MNSKQLNCINIGDIVNIDEIFKFIFDEYIMTFIDWDGTGTISVTDAIRTTVASIMILLTPHGLYIIKCIISNTSPEQDITLFLMLYDVLSAISAAIIFIFSIAILMDMLGKLSKIELYKYR